MEVPEPLTRHVTTAEAARIIRSINAIILAASIESFIATKKNRLLSRRPG